MGDPSLKQELLESTVVDIGAFDNLEDTDLDFVMPVWMVIMIALVAIIFGIQAAKIRAKRQAEPGQDKKEDVIK